MRSDFLVKSALYSTLLLSGARAEDESSAEAATQSTAPVKLPTFVPTKLKAPFLEQFTDDWSSRWTASKAKKEDPKSDDDWAYVGQWAVEEPKVYKGIEGDKGLVLKNPAAHHAISAKFGKPIDNKGKTLVVQYEVKLQNTLECGGAYMKLLQDNKELQSEEFSNASPYIIMFGPDKCGSTNKVHFIFRHKNSKTGVYEEKHLTNAPLARIDKKTSLYTLIVRPDQTFSLLVNGESAKNGTLLEDFNPAVNPAKEIEDPNDTKPADWVDESRIPDSDATKPEDWDEDAPFEIPDVDTDKPADWLDDEPETIPDPEAQKPEDWDDEEDGDWIPPTVPNPKCSEAAGCGRWERPMMKNPDFKGKWTAPYIDNPAFKGVWKPALIPNPDYYEDNTPSNFEPIGAIGFELWTMQSDILFDNIYIGHSEEDAAKLRAETFGVKRPVEAAVEDAETPDIQETVQTPSDIDLKSDPILYAKTKATLFLEILKEDPLRAVKDVPEVPGALGALLVLLVTVILSVVGGSSPAVQAKAKEAAASAKKTAVDVKDKAAEAVATGSEKVQAEVNKRTTRSSSKE